MLPTLATTIALAASPARAASNDVIAVDLGDGRPIALLAIAGEAPVSAIFDTGTTDNLIDIRIAERLHLPHLGSANVVDAATGKAVPGFATKIPAATLGGVRLTDVAVNAIDRSGRVAAVFGPNTFSGRLVVLELGKNRIRIAEKGSIALEGVRPYPYSDDGADSLPLLPIQLAGVDVRAVMDTGSDTPITLPRALAARLPLEAPPKQSGTVRSAAGDQAIYSAVLRGDAVVGPRTLHDPTLEFTEGSGDVGNVGLPLLRRMTVVLDPAARRTWLLPPD